ncbi:hypothetical protein K443DRAFT_333014 [Laccaria amethystina LaAM-08-1]|uniref:Uncharacterized protein n=1 Tax=Laccaria amethystina LaAM-08-1 TaxID=1095629 RepID=A0A0C9XGD2_9AGAR|nr:hypothetical protein K443DRAFT_333014 [Laccaria amethystina LaAM-08-1]
MLKEESEIRGFLCANVILEEVLDVIGRSTSELWQVLCFVSRPDESNREVSNAASCGVKSCY